ncbi:MAG: hypothetical protein AAFO15_01015 [Pseudomonadota bacterium]
MENNNDFDLCKYHNNELDSLNIAQIYEFDKDIEHVKQEDDGLSNIVLNKEELLCNEDGDILEKKEFLDNQDVDIQRIEEVRINMQ